MTHAVSNMHTHVASVQEYSESHANVSVWPLVGRDSTTMNVDGVEIAFIFVY